MTKHKCNEAGQAPTSKNGPMIDYTAYVLLNRGAPVSATEDYSRAFYSNVRRFSFISASFSPLYAKKL